VTVSGVATAVALTPPAVAVAWKGCHKTGSMESQVARLTTLKAAGLTTIDGDGRAIDAAACTAAPIGDAVAAPESAEGPPVGVGIHSA
jgi:hypothetical protein